MPIVDAEDDEGQLHQSRRGRAAVLESRIAIEELLRRFPDYEVPAGGIERMHSSNVRGLAGLTLRPA